MYQSRYFTINSTISECDHKCETWNADPEIGTDGSSQTRRNPRVDRYGTGFGLTRVSGSGFWTGLEPNQPVFAVQTRTAGGLPGPVANTSPCTISVWIGTLSSSTWHCDVVADSVLLAWSLFCHSCLSKASCMLPLSVTILVDWVGHNQLQTYFGQ